MNSFGIFKISASALEAQRMRMNVIASNMANVHSTKSERGGPYVRKDVVFSAMPVEDDLTEVCECLGVRVAGIVEDPRPPVMVYNPGHPDADESGYVAMPGINVIEEMVNMMMAMRAYEANVTTFNMSKSMFRKTLELGRQ